MEPHRPNPGIRPRKSLSERPAADASIEEWLEAAALRYAAKWETTERGVCEALERKLAARSERLGEDLEADRALIPGIAARMVERGYVDDRRFAEQLAARLERQGRSRAYLASKLRSKGVAEEIIDELTQSADPNTEVQAAWRLARKRRIGPYCPDPDRRLAQRDKHLGVLARQGFSLDLATQIVDADAPPNPEGEEE